MTSESDPCPVCGDEYVKKREIRPRGQRSGKTGTDSVAVRDDYTACRETETKLEGGHGNWTERQVTTVYIHS